MHAHGFTRECEGLFVCVCAGNFVNLEPSNLGTLLNVGESDPRICIFARSQNFQMFVHVVDVCLR